jgi:hypothetical protein
MDLTWTVDDIEIVFDDTATEDPVVTADIDYPGGTLSVMASAKKVERRIELDGLHVHGSGGANSIGHAKIRRVVRLVMEKLDIDEVFIRPSVRTTGAYPGHRPGDFRFTRTPKP